MRIPIRDETVRKLQRGNKKEGIRTQPATMFTMQLAWMKNDLIFVGTGILLIKINSSVLWIIPVTYELVYDFVVVVVVFVLLLHSQRKMKESKIKR